MPHASLGVAVSSPRLASALCLPRVASCGRVLLPRLTGVRAARARFEAKVERHHERYERKGQQLETAPVINVMGSTAGAGSGCAVPSAYPCAYLLTPYSYLLAPCSYLLTPCAYLLAPYSFLFAPCSYLLTPEHTEALQPLQCAVVQPLPCSRSCSRQ